MACERCQTSCFARISKPPYASCSTRLRAQRKKGASLHARALSRSTVARRLLLVAAEDAFQDAAQAIRAMMNTPDGKRLMALLGADGGKTLREAANAVQQGNEKRAQDTMAPLLSNPEVQKILSAMNRNLNHG